MLLAQNVDRSVQLHPNVVLTIQMKRKPFIDLNATGIPESLQACTIVPMRKGRFLRTILLRFGITQFKFNTVSSSIQMRLITQKACKPALIPSSQNADCCVAFSFDSVLCNSNSMRVPHRFKCDYFPRKFASRQ